MKLFEQITSFEPTLEAYAIQAFYTGGDYFKETVVSVIRTFFDDGKLTAVNEERYVVVLQLVQSNGHPCTSSVGFYHQGDFLTVTSGEHIMDVKITPTIERQMTSLRKAHSLQEEMK